MKIIFYQANFCAECGNPIKPRFSWRPRYFCEECEAQMGSRSYFKPAAGLLLCATLAVFALNRSDRPNPSRQTNAGATASIVSARDTVASRNRVSESEAIEPVFCGARTKKGTPCKRLVSPGRRCAQHRGMASLLEMPASKDDSAKRAEAKP